MRKNALHYIFKLFKIALRGINILFNTMVGFMGHELISTDKTVHTGHHQTQSCGLLYVFSQTKIKQNTFCILWKADFNIIIYTSTAEIFSSFRFLVFFVHNYWLPTLSGVRCTEGTLGTYLYPRIAHHRNWLKLVGQSKSPKQ